MFEWLFRPSASRDDENEKKHYKSKQEDNFKKGSQPAFRQKGKTQVFLNLIISASHTPFEEFSQDLTGGAAILCCY